MTEETIVAPVVETQTQPTVTTNEPETVAQDATEDAGHKPDSAEAKPEKTPEQKELDYLRRKATRADRINARQHQELEQFRQRQTQSPQSPQQPGQPQVDPVQLARQIAQAERTADKSNDIAKDGQKRFAATWNTALQTVIAEAGPLIDPQSMLPTPLGEAILDSDDAAALIEYLGSDPVLAEELSDLSPAQLGRRIARMEAAMKDRPAPRASNAPAPIKPLAGGSSATTVDLSSLSIEKYQEARAKQGARWARR